MIIDCISDLHGHYPRLEGGDLLIVAGDWCANDSEQNLRRFEGWLLSQGSSQYKKIIVIAGNHDNSAYEFKKFGLTPYLQTLTQVEYLCDSGTEFENLTIWGSPWTKTFPGINPHCKAFTVDTEEQLDEKWKLIPNDIDILITHSPPWGILDKTIEGRNVGSLSLHKHGSQRIRPILSVYGHIHEAYGETGMENIIEGIDYKFVNACHVNECYQPINKPIRVIL